MPHLACKGGSPVRTEFLTFGRPQIGEAEIAEVVDTLRSGWIGFGPKCLRFESDFARYTGADHAISVSSATAALHLALIAAGVGQGDEVITTPLTFASTANVIVHVGARPVFVDVDRRTQNIDPGQLSEAITPRTRAIIPVHMAGWPCDMNTIGSIAAANGLEVIEDAAHAVEGWSAGKKVGAISRFTAFSFYATKNLTTAEGGMLTTDDATVADRLRALRLHGLDKDAWSRYSPGGFVPYQTLEPGYKYNMTDLQASLGLHQLDRLEPNLRTRERIWHLYDRGLEGLDGVNTPDHRLAPGSRHARHLYTIRLDPARFAADRIQFMKALAAENIGTGIHFVPIHLHRYYAETFGYRRGDFPNAESIGDRTLSLPLSAGMTETDAIDVIEAVRKVAQHYLRRTSLVAVRHSVASDLRRESA